MLVVVTREIQHAAGEDDVSQVGLYDETAPEAFHNQHRVDGVPAEPASTLWKRYPEPSELGERSPVIFAVSPV